MTETPAIIPRIPCPEHSSGWQAQLADCVSSVDELLDLLEIEPSAFSAPPLPNNFRLRVPRSFVARMRKGDVRDPLLLQCLPLAVEGQTTEGYTADPLGEQHCMPTPGLLHKYDGRALLTVTGACGIHCRYCFRRHFPYADANPAAGHLEETLAWLQAQTGIREVILSGGDPLSLDDPRLGDIARRLDALPHVQTIRFHTRLPVALPARIDNAFTGWISRLAARVVMVIHSNHANEIDEEVGLAMQRVRDANVTLLNQSVLLRGVNDSADSLVDLSERLFSAGVLPYYLHQLDHVEGAAHFAVDDSRARELVDEVRSRLPGYLVPVLVREEIGAAGKTPL